MAYRENLNNFLTPDRRPLPDTPFKQMPTTSGRGNYQSKFPEMSPGFANKEIDGRVQVEENGQTEKLRWFQSRVAELRVYMSECPKIEKRKIRQIFNWGENGGLDGGQEKKLLKQLGNKVRGLIKENNQLRQNLYSEEIGQLKIQNERLKRLMGSVGRGEAVRERILNEENQYMREYIQRSGPRNSMPEKQVPRNRNQQLEYEFRQSQPIRTDLPQCNEVNQPLFNAQPLSLERLKNLKKYFTLYVNTAIEENDDKMIAQQMTIKSLQNRLTQLQKIQKQLDHLQFEKKVKLQESGKKIKNYSFMVPNVRGDPLGSQYGIQNQVQPNQPERLSHFSDKERQKQQKQIGAQQLVGEARKLRKQNNNIRQKYDNLKQKYEVEIENHIKDNVAKQQLSFKLQKIQSEYQTMLKVAVSKVEAPNQ